MIGYTVTLKGRGLIEDTLYFLERGQAVAEFSPAFFFFPNREDAQKVIDYMCLEHNLSEKMYEIQEWNLTKC